MKSVAAQIWPKVRDGAPVSLFQSHRSDISDGGQARDFVYVRDAAEIVAWLVKTPAVCGVYNLGSGRARTFEALAQAVFAAAGKPANIAYVPMPEAIRDKYQYFTEARMGRLQAAGYNAPMTPLEAGVAEYVRGFLSASDPAR
jgi:ADP-L-glycero-D-manno-heptose 6-epimerase